MSYHLARRPALHRYGARRSTPPQGLGGVFDFLFAAANATPVADKLRDMANAANDQTQMTCIAAANASPAVSALEARWYNLANNWQPTGLYDPADVVKIVKAGTDALGQARLTVLMSPTTTSDAQDRIADAVRDIDTYLADAQRFIVAASAASAGDHSVDAPDLKHWIVGALEKSSLALTVASVLQCNATWLDTAASYVEKAEAVVLAIPGLALDAVVAAGKGIIKVVGGAFDLAVFVATWGPWLALAGAGYWAYSHYLKKR